MSIVIEEREHLDVGGLLRGEIACETRGELVASGGIHGERQVIEPEELALLLAVPESSWTALSQLAAALAVEPERIEALAHRGLLLSDLDEPAQTRNRQQDEALASGPWHPAAVSFWAASRRELAGDGEREADNATSSEEARTAFASFVERHGAPPPAFHEIQRSEAVVELPAPAMNGDLHDLLQRRVTRRRFESGESMAAADLATLLYRVFGCQGTSRFSGEVTLLAKTSPSGGSLHPIEAYPIVLGVDGIPSGIYHYGVRRHTLHRLRQMAREEAERLAVALACGQRFVGTAGVVVLLAARFGRNFWKYRRSARTLAVILMDAGHLGQTFYLTAAELGLGAFYSAAVDLDLAAESLEIDGVTQGALALCGCGPIPEGRAAELVRQPYDPLSERS